MTNLRLVLLFTSLLIVALCWGTQTSAVAEPNTGKGKSDAACARKHTACVNGCRNGATVPIGSPQTSVDACDLNCDNNYNKCYAARGGMQENQLQVVPTNPARQMPPFPKGGINAPIMRRGIDGEQSTSSEREGK